MYLCYVDESGDSQALLNSTHNEQPLLVISGLLVKASSVPKLTIEFTNLKRKYYPKIFSGVTHNLNVLLHEVKGSDLRTEIRNNPLNSKIINHHFRFLDEVLAIIKKHDAKIISRIWIKQFNSPINDQSVYSITIQNICARFQEYLSVNNSNGGILIADFRDPKRNSYVSHSVFTQKHKMKGDAYPLIQEIPTFGVSNNHACLQITDLLCSALLAPMASRIFLTGTVNNVHTHKNYDAITKRYKKRLKTLQFNCDVKGVKNWGITVDNPHKTGVQLFA
ncbi:MAG TPA: DUF3800 domain-containing protein [Gallionellaceae bacterium]|nr:DUF3800 domain-containing protein [Gallionellaceae bacterium]